MGRNRGPARVVYARRSSQDGDVPAQLRNSWDGLSLTVVEDVESAVEAVDPDVDAVLTHQQLGEGTGLELHRRLNPTDRTVPVVLLVEETTPEVAAAAVEADVAGYVPVADGIDLDRVVDVLADAVGTRQERVPTDEEMVPKGHQSVTEWKALLLDQLFTRLPVHLFVKDREGQHVLMSEGLVDDPEKYLGSRDIDGEFVPQSEAEAAYEDDMRVIENAEPIIDKEEYYESLDRWFLTSKVPLYGPDGEVTGLIGVSREITERKKAERELSRSNERLDQFASVVSHDLRSPLAVATGNLELLGEGIDEDEHLAAIRRALERMDRLVEELLTLARQGEDAGETEQVSLQSAAETCWRRIATADASLTVSGSASFLADSTRVEQLFENLFRNAVEHGGEGVRVTVGPLEDGGGFFVADDGPGIPGDALADIFEPGYTTDDRGTGFGLFIVKEVARAHDWEVSVTDSESGGARFEVRGVESAQ